MVTNFQPPRSLQDLDPPVLTVVGIGRLGRAFAAWALHRGLRVRAKVRTPQRMEAASQAIHRAWEHLQRHTDSSDVSYPAARLEITHELIPAVQDARWIYEALPEDPVLKAQAWRDLMEAAEEHTILITGTSSIPPRHILDEGHERLRLLHVFLPLRSGGACEILQGEQNPAFHDLLARLQLHPIMVQPIPGFAGSRLALLQGLEAMRLLEAGVVASAKDLDRLMVEGYGHAIGPLELSDRIGLDVRLAIAEHLFQATGHPQFQPPDILRTLVQQGALGRKCGRGFYTWPTQGLQP